MDFSVTEEQTMLADTVARYIDNDYSFEQRMAIAESDSPFSTDVWRNCAELGLLAVPFTEEDGGLGGGPVEMMLIMEQFGRGLVVEPFLANVVLAGGVMKRAASAAQRAEILGGIIDGSKQAALAFAEPQSRYTLANIETTARAQDGGFVLAGRKTLTLNAQSADVLLIPARTSGAGSDEDGISLFAVPAPTQGLTLNAYKTVDGHSAAELILDGVAVPESALIGERDAGYAPLQAAVDDATLAVCAEAAGIVRVMHEKTVEYTKSRSQFGVPIGSFQALQHRMVDSLMGCEQTRSLLLWAVMLAAEGSPEAPRAISALKYQVGTAGRRVAQEAVQLHGGMGVTWELDIAHYFKRHAAIELLFGNADYHLDRYLALS